MSSLSRTASAIRASVFADLAPHIERFKKSGGELLPLHIGDTHVEPPSRFGFVVEHPDLYAYGPLGGTPELKAAIGEHLERSGYPRQGILVASGATHALYCAARAVLDPGDEVIVPSPYWPLSVGVLQAAGAKPVEVPLTQRLYADPSLDAGALLEAAVTPATRALYLITPNNPDGKVLSRGQLESIARVARHRDLWVLSDEVYAEYTYALPHVSIASLPGMADRTVSAFSFSKSHALAGARVGFVAGPERLVELAHRVATHTVFNVPVVAQRVAARALTEGKAWVAAAREEYVRARDASAAALEGSGVRFHLAEGGTYLFLDFADVLGGRPVSELFHRAIERGVLLAPGDAFGAGFERCARLCYTAVPLPRALDGISRLRAAIDDLGG